MQDEVKVSQADRNAAVRLLEQGGQDWQAKEICLGQGDHFPIVQSLARHRHQAEREALARMEWRDIESAPKDWTDVLVFSPEHEGFNCGGVFSAFYDTHEACWFTHGPGHNIRLKPTRWMPLPPTPEAGQ